MCGSTLQIVGIEQEHQYEMSLIIRLFSQAGDFHFVQELVKQNGMILEFSTEAQNLGTVVTLKQWTEGVLRHTYTETLTGDVSTHRFQREIKRAHLRLVWNCLAESTGYRPPWGILTGVRPTKVALELLDEEHTDSDRITYLTDKFRMESEKASLILNVARREKEWIFPLEPSRFGLYYAIPFCPTRCSYCSFTAYTGVAKLKQLDAYVDSMISESNTVASALHGRKVDSLYIGGGTPTMLEPRHFEKLLSHIRTAYDLSNCREITVEAGRPDTITLEKLQVLKEHGVGRICLNPQSFSAETLKRIGRSHSVDDVYRTVEMIRSVGFQTLNMDIILGLPGETEVDVAHTMACIETIRPENLTVHTLALKRGSELRNAGTESLTDANMKSMIRIAAEGAARIGMNPYYLYRQKFMVENLENVGYALPGHECIYNMQMMEEFQDILSFGAGGISKICFPEDDRHERVPNVKGLEEYLLRWPEMADRKTHMLSEK